jgi:hypothetical protein
VDEEATLNVEIEIYSSAKIQKSGEWNATLNNHLLD